MRSVAALVLIALLSVPALRAADNKDYTYEKDVQDLLKAELFGFGPIFMTSNITPGEAALRRIMKEDDAIKFLFPVFDHGTPEGKCYALIGFRLLAPDYFESSCKRVARWNNSKIKAVSGCIVGNVTLAEIVQAIREGRYDDAALGKKKG